jgi:SAM-dependent methyltransferase
LEGNAVDRDDVVARYGPWTAHNFRLGDGTYTISPEPTGDEAKLRRVVQLVADLTDGNIAGLRILDLASLEGMYALELARRGAQVVAIEGREANIEKARFAARSLGLDVDFQLGDVRDLSIERHGKFDVVLCLGILYHLDLDDVASLLGRIRQVTKNAMIVDTAVALASTETHVVDGVVLHGERLVEHGPSDTEEQRLARLWSSLDNTTAFLPTLPSLLRLLSAKGFPTVLQAHLPAEPEKPDGRVTLVTMARTPVVPILTPEPPAAEIPEGHRSARRARSLRELVPAGIRRRARRALGRPEPL